MRPCCGLLVLLPAATLAADPPAGPRVTLDRYYAELLRQPFIQPPDAEPAPSPPPPWKGAFRRLASDDATVRRAGVAELGELVSLALADERAGTAPNRPTPFWGESENYLPARVVRASVAGELEKVTPSPELVPLLRWYFENESDDRFLPDLAAVLAKTDGPAADALRLELAITPHPNAAVATAALRQLAARKIAIPADRLAALCQHHRRVIRDAAQALNRDRGGPDPGPFDPAKAIRREPVAGVVARVRDVLPDLPEKDVRFVKVTSRNLDAEGKEVEVPDVVYGWLIRQGRDVVEVYTPRGYTRLLRDRKPTKALKSVPAPNGFGVSAVEVDAVTAVTVDPADAGAVGRAMAARRAEDQNDAEPDRWHDPFDSSGPVVRAATLAAWLYRAGRDSDAAALVLPLLDTFARDEHLVLNVRVAAGDLVGHRMLAAFAGDRDYPAALRHARVIRDHYPGTRFHTVAERMLGELPRRADDFTRLKLPTPAEWAALKKTLTRDQQIDYLCERMRLLNCFQYSQPGGYDPGESQCAEARGMAADASWGGRMGKTAVINPLTELTGQVEWGTDGPEGRGRHPGLRLTSRDVPRLSKYLRDNYLMLVVTFGRDFVPGRSVETTQPLFESIINDAAGAKVCEVRGWEKLTPAEIDQKIEQVNQRAEQQAGLSVIGGLARALRVGVVLAGAGVVIGVGFVIVRHRRVA